MTMFTSPDPRQRICAGAVPRHAAKQYHERANDILIRIFRGGTDHRTVLDAGVQGWNEDGSANVLVVTQIT